MKPNPKSIDRSFQNPRNEVVETDVPKSGINLSYRNHLGGLVLGRLYPQSVQHLMPNDKFSGSNEASMTFEQLATPVIDDVDVCVHNFLVTLRSIDNRFEKFMTPSKLNNMNTGVSVPTFNIKSILRTILVWFGSAFTQLEKYDTQNSRVTFDMANLSFPNWNYVYHTDSFYELDEQIVSLLGSSQSLLVDTNNTASIAKFKQLVYLIFDFFVGKRSLLDYLGYTYYNHNQLSEYVDVITSKAFMSAYDSESAVHWLLNDVENATGQQCCFFGYNSNDDVWEFESLPDIIENEYALRAYYAIWFEYYRNYDLEPRHANLPEYRDFGAATIFDQYSIDQLHYLVPRIRSWQQDFFTTAGIDDISRHVFAPILDNYSFTLTQDSDLQPSNIVDNTLISQRISWRDPSTGNVSTIDVPIPARLGSLLQKPSQAFAATNGVELFSIRKAAMLENYLKRIYYGGDEYRDRMLHLYGARIEDYRINRPQWLSSSIDSVDPKQEVANTGVKPGDTSGFSIGERIATATAKQSGTDGFTDFCPEFGVYISMLSIMPHASYDPYLMQNQQVYYSDFPIPQFANQMEDVISTREISRSVHHAAFGYAPYAHAYRYRVDEIHGDYHDDKFDYTFLRFFNESSIPNLSWSFIHCRPKLPMFVNSILLDGQVYGTFKHNFLVERPLPSPVETI